MDSKFTRDFQIAKEELERRENELRSNLRYAWQKTASFIVNYNPPIYEIEEKLVESFLIFIPLTFSKRKRIERLIKDSFAIMLESLLKTNNITSEGIENRFIEISIENLRGLLI